MRKFLLFLCLLLALAGAAACGGLRLYHARGPLETVRAVIVPRGGIDSTIQHLQDGRVLDAGWLPDHAFRVAVALTRKQGQLHAAELEFPPHASIAQILFVLRHGKPVQHQVTVAEGLTARRIGEIIADAPLLSGPMPTLHEGEVLPQTYDYQWGMTRAQIVDRMRLAMRGALARVWADRDPDPTVPDMAALLTLASIVERETGVESERAQVARVFLNRLALGMKLQSDPTTIYDLSDGSGVLDRPLTHADLAESGPYNTYVIAGLPPGPICSPGMAALMAVAHPAPGKALYFVASGVGGHVFSDTLDEHNHNVAQLRARQAGVAK